MTLQQDNGTPARKSPAKRHDDITLAAQAIMDKERSDRVRKSERLRTLRLAKEQADALLPAPAVKKRKSKS